MVTPLPLRRTWRTLALALTMATGMLMPTSSMADTSCMQSALSDRTNQLQSAYNDYSRDMQKIANDLATRENNANNLTDSNQQANERNRARNDYSNAAVQIGNTLQLRISQAWNNYQARVQSCGGTDTSNYYSQYPYNYNSSYNYGNYSGYYGYPYNYGYGSPGSYTVYSTCNPPYYGNNGGYYPNNNYGYSPYYNSAQLGGSSYSWNGQIICVKPILNYPLPAGCGYDCSNDSNGCQRCQISCRGISAKHYRGCGCTTTYRPVCGRDEITYVNDCYADCADVEVRHMGVCK